MSLRRSDDDKGAADGASDGPRRISPEKVAAAKDKLSGAADKVSKILEPPDRSVLDKNFKRERAIKVERRHEWSVVWISFFIIVISSAVFFLIGWLVGDGDWTYQDFFYNMGCNILGMFVAVLCLDTLVNHNRDARARRDEARKILRYNRLISPEIDMYLVRKNMVVTPAGRTLHKFRVKSEFHVSDMRDMYGPSELVSDVGISKIKRFAHYQGVLAEHFEKLVENVDFTFYPEIADAAMRYLNASSYGQPALDAVVSYEDARSGNRSVRAAVVAMIRAEPEDGRFIEANATMKNVYLVEQMIRDQESAIADYIEMIRKLQQQEPQAAGREQLTDYE